MSGSILITRPQNQAEAFAKSVHALGLETLIAPMISVEPVAFETPDLNDFQALIFTSAQGVKFFTGQVRLRDIAVYVVGPQTEQAALAAGFEEVYSADGDAGDLVDLIDNEAPDTARPFLYVRAKETAKPLEEMLEKRGFTVESLIAYETKNTATLPEEIVQSLKAGDIQAVTFFSKRTAENFVKAVSERGLADSFSTIKALCLGDSMLEYVRLLRWQDTYVSDKPDQENMLALVVRECGPTKTAKQDNPMQGNDKEDAMSAANTSKGQSIDNASEVIERFGGIRPMAKKIDVAVTTVQGWKKRDRIPAGRRKMILNAAQEHSIDLSDLLKGAPHISTESEKSSGGPANENAQATAAPTPGKAAPFSTPETQAKTTPERTFEAEVAKVEPVKPSSVPPTSVSSLKADPRASIDTRLRQTERNAIKKSTWINFALLIVGLLAVGAFLLFGGNEERMDDMRLGELEENVDQLRGDVDAVKEDQSFLTTMIPQDLDQRIQRIQDQASEAQQKVNQAIATAGAISNDVLGPDGGTFEERAAKLQNYAAASPQVHALLERFSEMSASMPGQEQLDQAIAQLNNALAGSGAGLELEEALDSARQSAPAVGEAFENVPKDELKAAALLLGMTQLRSALNRDNENFTEDLQLMKNLVSSGEATPENDALLAALDKLAPRAQEGVLTPAGLTDEFRTIAGEAVVESLKGEDVSLSDKVTARFSELLQVEKDGELVNGTPTQETLSRAENMLESGDIAGAIAAVETLDGDAALVAQPWLDEARTTLLAESLKNFLQGGLSSAAQGGELIPAQSKFVHDPESGISILVPGKGLGSDAYQ
ncbi:MAG: uroporphyrinogen-III synthase [Alphaproteobacteria bacterium]|nr:uroporphyrinogen-III synthase [Alphaproteobacteria bacterium]